MPNDKKFILKDLVVEEVSLVDSPANPEAHVLIYKRDVEKDGKCPDCGAQMEMGKCPSCGYEAQKAAEEAEEKEHMADAQKLQAELDAAKKLAEENAAKATAAEAKAAELQKKLDALENTPEAVEKRKLEAMPESVRKEFSAMKEEIAKAREEKAEAEAIAKAKADFSNLPGKAEDIAKIYRKATSGLTAEEKAEFDKTLKSASEALKSNLFVERGRGGAAPVSGSPEAQMEVKIDELRKANPKLSYAEAALQVAKAHPEIYEAVDKAATLVTSVN